MDEHDASRLPGPGFVETFAEAARERIMTVMDAVVDLEACSANAV